MSIADSGNLPPRPPILPPAINEDVFAPKRQMQQVKDAAQKRLKKFHGKFEKLVRKFLKKAGEKERYLKFYDIGYRYEAVFSEITSDGQDYLGATLPDPLLSDLLKILQENLKLPQASHEEIGIHVEKNPAGEALVIQLVAEPEWQEIQRLSEKVRNAPRLNNPGL